MAKKSRKRAARYSELSKSRRKQRQAAKPGTQPQVIATPETQEVAAVVTKKTPVATTKSPVATKSPAAQKGPKTQPGLRFNIPDYKYVRNDLKRVGILTAAIIVVIIILAFVLG